MSDTVKLIRMRNRLLSLAAAAFLAWQGAILYGDAAALFSAVPALPGASALIETIGALGWAAATLLFLVYMGRVSRARVQDVIEDELFRHNKQRAVHAGFMAMIATLAICLGFAVNMELPAEPVLRLILMAGVGAPLFTFVFLARDDMGEDV